MTDPLLHPLTQQLARELGRRADEVSGDPALIAHVVRRGHLAHRRRTAGVVLAACVAVAAVIAGIAVPTLHNPGPHHPVSTPTSTPTRTSATPDPLLGPLRLPYAVNGTTGSAGAWTPSTIHLPPSAGGRTVRLPERWLVERIVPSGSGAVADVRVAHSAGPTRFAIYVSPSGAVRVLRNLDVGALPLDATGQEWVSARPGAAMDRHVGSRVGVSIVRPDSDDVTAMQPGVPADRMVAVLADRSVVVQNSVDQLQVWPLDGTGRPGRTIDVRGTPWFWRDIAADGRVLVQAPHALHLLSSTGAELWSWDEPAGRHWGLPPRFSPDGTRIAVSFQDGYAVLSAASAAVIVEPGAHPGLAALGWEEPDTVIAVASPSTTGPQGFERCVVSTGRCAALDLPDGAVLAIR